MFRKILKTLFIIQERSNLNKGLTPGGIPPFGRGFSKAYRINPYNPLSYLFLLVVLLVGILMFGIVGFWKEIEVRNPFRWN
jgi:hypothetical protein